MGLRIILLDEDRIWKIGRTTKEAVGVRVGYGIWMQGWQMKTGITTYILCAKCFLELCMVRFIWVEQLSWGHSSHLATLAGICITLPSGPSLFGFIARSIWQLFVFLLKETADDKPCVPWSNAGCFLQRRGFKCWFLLGTGRVGSLSKEKCCENGSWQRRLFSFSVCHCQFQLLLWLIALALGSRGGGRYGESKK